MEKTDLKPVADEKPPRPVAVWIGGTIAYAVLVLLLGLLLDGVDPDSRVFPPLLTALAGLFVATAINVRPGPVTESEVEWNRFQTHVIVVAVTSMVLSIGLVMCALAFPGDEIGRLAFWAAAIAILIGAAFMLATVWNRLSGDEPVPAPAPAPEPESASDPEPEPEPEPNPEPEPDSKPEPDKKKETRRAPQPELVAETLKKTKKPKKKADRKKSKKKDSKKKS